MTGRYNDTTMLQMVYDIVDAGFVLHKSGHTQCPVKQLPSDIPHSKEAGFRQGPVKRFTKVQPADQPLVEIPRLILTGNLRASLQRSIFACSKVH